MKTKTTQVRVIYKALQAGRTLTAYDALQEFGVGRLAACVFRLRKHGRALGYRIETKQIPFINQRTGRAGRCAGYVLIKTYPPGGIVSNVPETITGKIDHNANKELLKSLTQ